MKRHEAQQNEMSTKYDVLEAELGETQNVVREEIEKLKNVKDRVGTLEARNVEVSYFLQNKATK